MSLKTDAHARRLARDQVRYARRKRLVRHAGRLAAAGLHPSRTRLAASLGWPEVRVQKFTDREVAAGRWPYSTGRGKFRYSDAVLARAIELQEEGLGIKRTAKAIRAEMGLAVSYHTIAALLGGRDDPEAIKDRKAAIRPADADPPDPVDGDFLEMERRRKRRDGVRARVARIAQVRGEARP